MKTTVTAKYFVNDCLWKPFVDSNSSQTPSNLISLTILVTLSLLHSFEINLEQLSCKKGLKFALLESSCCDLSTEVEIWY